VRRQTAVVQETAIETDLRRLLIIDDDEAILSMLADTLSPDYHIVTAQDWLEGTDLLMKEQVDLLLVDLAMPVFDGLEFITKIRSEPQHAELPVIVMSAYADMRERLAGADVQAIIAKPFSVERLMQTNDALTRGSTHQTENV
jgi:DNA-binding response OmpR family regulator